MVREAVDSASMDAFPLRSGVRRRWGDAQGLQWLEDTSLHMAAVTKVWINRLC